MVVVDGMGRLTKWSECGGWCWFGGVGGGEGDEVRMRRW